MDTITSRRRTLFAAASSVVIGSGITAGAAASVADLATPAGAEPSLIVAMALRIKATVERENYLDEKDISTGLSPAEKAEEKRIYYERMDLSKRVVSSTPLTVADAMIVIMHGADQINIGNECLSCSDMIQRGERAIRRAYIVLVRELGVDMRPFGSENFMPEHLSRHRAGRVAA